MAKIKVTPYCWLWTASTKENGYGQFNSSNRNWNAHRLVYELLVGPIQEGMELDHLCRVRHCVNPQHLEPVTRKVNVRRQFDAITHCPQGHEYNEENTYWHNGNRLCRKCRIQRATARLRRIRAEEKRNARAR
ncbi:HNH endonuclease signature motif containing protein [Glutamicibacter soli]